MKRVQATLERDGSLIRTDTDARVPLKGRIDGARVDRTTEAEIARQAADDDHALWQDAAAYARRVRRKTGLTQAAFATRIGVPLDTVRNWEQGKRLPAGPAKALLRILDRAPEAALTALE
ncbi:MAG: helix-turn-helix domain-containing protein [Rhodospirillales bacterium]|nr:helix-turn-helix domain-containing protein [Rhodospirillales bacterium]